MRRLIASLVSVVGVFIWSVLCLYMGLLAGHANYEILWYIGSFFVFVILYIVTKTIEKRIAIRHNLYVVVRENKYREIFFELVTEFGLAVISINAFLNDPYTFWASEHYMPWHVNRNVEILLIILGGISAVQCREMLKADGFRKNKKKINCAGWYIALALASGYAIYQPFFFSEYTNSFHFHAYFNSVYRVLNMQPYSILNSGVYGFYGIILMPFVKLLGGDYIALFRVMAIISIVSVLCYCYVLDNITDNTFLKMLGGIAIAALFIALQGRIYLQLCPHRVFMPAVVLAFISFCRKNNHITLKWDMIGTFLCILAIVWNFETGLACMLAYVGSNVVYHFQFKDTKIIGNVCCAILKCAIVIIGGWLFVGIYNLCVGGRLLTWKEFLFPLYGVPYVSSLNIELNRMPSAWMLVCILFFVVISIVLGSTIIGGKARQDDRLIIMAACVICASIQMIYYVNRSAWGNLFIVLPLSGILLSGMITYFIGAKVWEKNIYANGVRRAICVFSMISLSFVTFMTATNYLYYEGIRENNRNLSVMTQFAEEIKKNVPRDTFAIGIGLPEIYSVLKWKTGFYGIDMSDVSVLGPQYGAEIIKELMDENLVLVEDSALEYLLSVQDDASSKFYEGYQEIFSCSYGDYTYRLWHAQEG